ncbi:MAG: hypothetical protein ABIJ65_06165 [Chloroflexota bacterium]
MTKKKGLILSIILYILGAFIALVFAGSIIWANFELPFYFDYTSAAVRTENQGKSDLNCPIILTTKETGFVSTDIANNTDKTLNPVFRGEISYLGGIAREFEFKPTILPGESGHIEIEVNEDDIVFYFMILVRTFQLPTYKTPAQVGSCAIVMLPIPFLTGNQVYYLSLLVIILSFAAGIFLWVKYNHPLQGQSQKTLSIMILLAILLLAAIFSGILGGWMLGLLLLVLIVLLIMVAVVFIANSPPAKD